MIDFQALLAAAFFLVSVPAFADNLKAGKVFRDCPECPEMVVIPAGSFDMGANIKHFQESVAMYRAAKPKPRLSEEAGKYGRQAKLAVQGKQFDKAVVLYNKALSIAPWWPEGHYNRALILGETEKYRGAMIDMKLYLLLVPDAPDSRSAQDKLNQWEAAAKQQPEIDPDQKPTHRVSISRAFAMGKTEVTQGQWRAIMGNNPSYFSRCGDTCPVDTVSWDDAHVFIRKLNAKTGKQYRLPSEAEWEYACRAGGQFEYCGSDNLDSVMWYWNGYELNGKTTHPVATKQANAFGLYDMSGNLLEWVEDSWHDNYIGAPVDGSAWEGDGEKRVLRGGSWCYVPWCMRASLRDGDEHADRDYGNGFRLVRVLP